MYEYHATEAPRPERRQSSVIVFVSLYLLLLAFFILLNSISQPKVERARAAMGSVDATFRATGPTSPDATSKRSPPGPVVAPDTFQRELKSVFETALRLVSVESLEDGDVLQITVAADEVFAPRTAVFRERREDWLRNVAGALTGAKGEHFRRLEVVAGSALAGGPARGNDREIAIRRAGALATGLKRHGVPASMIVIGHEATGRDDLRFTFRDEVEDLPLAVSSGGLDG
jgi:hypothetical protein